MRINRTNGSHYAKGKWLTMPLAVMLVLGVLTITLTINDGRSTSESPSSIVATKLQSIPSKHVP
eukprot:scaffold8243_cov183-Amphora_coffeaeformis.AAC.1